MVDRATLVNRVRKEKLANKVKKVKREIMVKLDSLVHKAIREEMV